VTVDVLNISPSSIWFHAIARYNPTTQRILLLGHTSEIIGKERDFSSYLVSIDPNTKDVRRIEAKIGGRIGKSITDRTSNNFSGTPQDLVVHMNGSYTIIYEETEFKIGPRPDQFFTILKSMVISTYDSDGKILNEYFVPRAALINRGLAQLFLSESESRSLSTAGGEAYKFPFFVFAKDKIIAIVNDLEENEVKSNQGKKLSIMRSVGGTECYYYLLSGDTVFPKRRELFVRSPNTKGHLIGLTAVSDYDSESNILAIYNLEKEGPTSFEGKMIWIQF